MKYSYPMFFPVAVMRIIEHLLSFMDCIRTRLQSLLWGVSIGQNVRFKGKTIIRTRHKREIVLGDNVIFNSNQKANLVGLMGPTILDTLGGGKIKIDMGSGFSAVVISSRSIVSIGKNVKVGGNVRIFDHDYHALEADIRRTNKDFLKVRTRPIIIEDDCFIGTNAIILKGTHIGARSIIAAGSVVFGLDIPPDSMVKGNPACIV